MKSGLTWGKVIVGVCMVVVTYFVVTQVVLRQADDATDRATCQTVQGHIDGNYVDRGGHTMTLLEFDNVFKTQWNVTVYDTVTQRMLNSGPGQNVEICYDEDATSIVRGRIIREAVP